ncbi:LPS assembly lipoprotein LptE [Billgrantia lactosivorans]|uniref:LPS-assembly lipoprotein LptE n=1 Tax=Billgrantia lactosivorans TaxID=2185141 RepID=UPI000DAD1DAA|nr:LPS assembly lipoprotein LptE [Halomonas lactosivorans]
MQRRGFLNLALAASAVLALTGCGFRLRGFDTPGLAIDELALAGDDSELARLVDERLTSAGTRVHDDAPEILNLGPETFRERQLSVLDSGPQEREMTLSVPISVQRRSDGAYRLAEQNLEVTTRFTVSDDNLLAQDDLREEARQELRQEALRRLLDRLRALAEDPS